VIVVDNDSSDGTSLAAQAAWPDDAPVALRVVGEPCRGCGNAFTRGIAEARGELVARLDDDNWIAPDWIQTAWETMRAHPDVGACGGVNEPNLDDAPPAWFNERQGAYAAGSQGEAGDVTESRGYLWGGGFILRGQAWDQLVTGGFRPRLVGKRASGDVGSGDDAELCRALQLAGWRLWFEPRLRLEHRIAAHRIDWWVLRRMYRGIGSATAQLDPYEYAVRGERRRRGGWVAAAALSGAYMTRHARTLWAARGDAREGDYTVLWLEWSAGRLRELLRQRGAYNRSFAAIEKAEWRTAVRAP
jgi:hypothetical protein